MRRRGGSTAAFMAMCLIPELSTDIDITTGCMPRGITIAAVITIEHDITEHRV